MKITPEGLAQLKLLAAATGGQLLNDGAVRGYTVRHGRWNRFAFLKGRLIEWSEALDDFYWFYPDTGERLSEKDMEYMRAHCFDGDDE